MEKKKSGPELRRHARLDADYLIRYEAGSGMREVHVTNIKNISAGGAKFLVGEVLHEDQVIRLSILIPLLEKTVKTEASVLRFRRTRKKSIYSVAVRFIGISPDDQGVINAFVESLVREKDAPFVQKLSEMVKKNEAKS